MLRSSGRRLVYLNSHPWQYGLQGRQPEPKRLAVAICSQTGSGALGIAEKLAGHLQTTGAATNPPWQVFAKGLMAKVLEDHHLPTRLAKFLPEDARGEVDEVLDELLGLHPPSWVVVEQTVETILNLAQTGNVILVGWGACAVTAHLPYVFHVRLVSSLERRIARIQARENLSRKAAEAFIERSDRGRARYLRKHFRQEISNVLLYGLTVNTDRFSDAEVIQLIGNAVLQRRQTTPARSQNIHQDAPL